ncbi:Glycosyl transferase family 2 [Thiothrix eikelboomii]|uniref:Glycosyl transferase family 2 n=1 Tax=Thiothrix eikelboomii TaxID=92487 RepID=A0A1T4Y7C8_9GAMM|nr:glycosyltransferase [Thiothrix eikelboomii]SKA97428.1 Glycosyl transferase family 2 [Thiothrix eikelboomii]
MNKFVSVIVPTYHNWDGLKLCIDALATQSYPFDAFEVIIVNNDPDDHEPNFNLPENFRLVSQSKPGSYAARNAALALATGEIIAFTDSDCIPDTDWIKNAAVRLEAGAERIAGRIDLFFKSEKLTLIETYEKIYAFDQASYAKSGWAVTANMITWRKNFDVVGWFNDSLMSGGDIEWSWRANDLGISVEYAHEVVVKHPARDSLAAMLQKCRRVAGGTVNIDRKETRHSLLMFLLRGYLPSVSSLLKPWKKSDITLIEKFIAIGIYYYIKIYSTTYMIGLKFGIYKIERV